MPIDVVIVVIAIVIAFGLLGATLSWASMEPPDARDLPRADRRYSGRRVQVREGPRKSPTGFFRALIWRSLLQRTAGLLRIAMVPFTLVRCEP
jgi:hypothetical protein